MNFPLSKIKGGRSCDYSYRGIKVRVVRNYSFNGDYVRSSFYDVPSMAIFASSPKELKRRIDAKLNQVKDIRIDEQDSLILWRALEAYRNKITSGGYDAIESHYAPASLLLAKVMHASCDLADTLEEGETVQTIYDGLMDGTS